MQIKLIAMDLDGTLMLPDHQRVGETTRRALAACRQQGVRLALATGRTLALTEPVQAQLPFLDYIVFSNGAGVWDVQNKKRIHSDPMQLADARQICAYLDSRPVYYEFYADGVPVAPARRKGMARLDGVPDSFVDELLEKVVYRDSVADALVGMTVEKLNLFTIPMEENRALRAFLQTMGHVEITSSIGCNVEAGKVGTSKATALAALCGQLDYCRHRRRFGAGQNAPRRVYAASGRGVSPVRLAEEQRLSDARTPPCDPRIRSHSPSPADLQPRDRPAGAAVLSRSRNVRT